MTIATPTPVKPSIDQLKSQPPAAASSVVKKWVEESVALCKPARVVWLDGSKAERDVLLKIGL
ncbi:MAG TPA: hypothetical protein PK402_14730, partial [Tepidisphaeraceae bacterium]|nr:hypothetical protein [Tepidisphaeraceae bacterium]